MKYGLSIEQLTLIKKIISGYGEIEEAILFGSRAIDTYKEASDVDIAIKGANVNFSTAAKLKDQLEEETYIPFFFDIIAYNTIKSEELIKHIDTKGIVIYSKSLSEWKEYKFSELLVDEAISYGIVQPGIHTLLNSIPIIRVNNIKNGHIHTDDILKVSSEIEDKYKRTRLIGGELLITVVGSIGECAIVPENLRGWNVARAVSVARIKEEFDVRFVKYSFATEDLVFQMYGQTNDTVQPTLNLSSLKEIKFQLPPLAEQKAIAGVLSSLDDKIDLLHRQNKTLEAMAETLFRQWFVEEADESWETRPLGELVTVKRGGSPRPIQNYLSDSGLHWLKISDATKESSPFIFNIKEYIKEEGLNKTTFLKKGTLVLSNSATPGIPKILQIDTCIHDGWLHFPKSHFSNEFLYLLFKKIRPELIQQGNGSIFTNLKTDILKEYRIPVADDNSLKFFDDQVNPIFEKLLHNTTQIRTLEKLRDTLLPKLMNGEVRVE
ncbi:MAG: restriction endonuclease subunit S [Melioribacteraceae bacterium]